MRFPFRRKPISPEPPSQEAIDRWLEETIARVAAENGVSQLRVAMTLTVLRPDILESMFEREWRHIPEAA